jgi:endo-1,4-beta-xylanase
MGLKVLVTEMDVNDRALVPEIALRDEAVAKTYESYLKTVVADPAVIAVLTWGITDKYTWLNGEDSRTDKVAERPLPFDAEMRAKPAVGAIRQALGSG